jgi:hypothetical protein
MLKYFSKEIIFVVLILFFCETTASEKSSGAQNDQVVNVDESLGIAKKIAVVKASEEFLSVANIVTIVCSGITLLSMIFVVVTTHKCAPFSKKIGSGLQGEKASLLSGGRNIQGKSTVILQPADED